MSGAMTLTISEICITSSPRGDPRHDILRRRGRGRQDRGIGTRQRDNESRQRLGQLMRIDRIVGGQDLFDAVESGGGGDRRFDRPAGDEDMNGLAQRFGRGQSLGGGFIEFAVLNFSENQNRHQITPASSFSLTTSSAAEPTLTPALRLAGSTVFKIFSRGVASTPKSPGVFSSMIFFFAFMMFGSEA